MEKVKIVARYLDGRTIKGFTQDFNPNKSSFHVFSHDGVRTQESLEILVSDLKAVFFVRDFAGKPDYDERKQFVEGEKPSGRIVEVRFTDGEVLVGSTLGYAPNRQGFFIFPADPQSNNARVFVVTKSARVRYV